MNRKLIVVTAAALFAAGSLAIPAYAEGVKCGGTNRCKGWGSCKSANNACKGQNSCKGKSFTEMSSEAECTAKNGKVL